MGIKSELHEAILKRGGKVPPYGGIAAAMDELNKLPGGGGDCDWNTMKNKPFYKETTEGEIFPKTTLAVDSELGMVILEGVCLVGGETYTITYNGVTYECIAQVVGDNVVVGNVGAMIEGGTDTGEPFVALNDEATSSVGLVPLDGSTAVEVFVVGSVTTIKTIDPDVLPCLFVDFEALDKNSATMISNIAYDTVISALESGQNVAFRQKAGITHSIFHLSSFDNTSIKCCFFTITGIITGKVNALSKDVRFVKGDSGNIEVDSYKEVECLIDVMSS